MNHCFKPADNPLRISIVTPSFNQSNFLEATIYSVLSQGYTNLDYRVIDGGSTDGSQEILQRYNNEISYWCSESDQGQYDAINKGFLHSNGDIMAWLNSDDMYTPWAFKVVSDIFQSLPEVEWLTTLCPIVWNATGSATSCYYSGGYTRKGFFRGENILNKYYYTLGTIQQESVFWRRSLWEKSGGYVDTKYNLAGDFELWARFFQYTDLYTVGVPLGGFRSHGNQRSLLKSEEYRNECLQILSLYGGFSMGKFQAILNKIAKQYIRLPYQLRKLAVKLGLKTPHRHCFFDPIAQRWQVINL